MGTTGKFRQIEIEVTENNLFSCNLVTLFSTIALTLTYILTAAMTLPKDSLA